MSVYFITFRSVTPAQRGEGILRRNGIRCALQRTPRWMEERGCGYCLRIHSRIGEAVALLQTAQVPFRKVYLQSMDGKAEEVVL